MQSQSYQEILLSYIGEAARQVAAFRRQVSPAEGTKQGGVGNTAARDPKRELADAFDTAIKLVQDLQKVQKVARTLRELFDLRECAEDPFKGMKVTYEGNRLMQGPWGRYMYAEFKPAQSLSREQIFDAMFWDNFGEESVARSVVYFEKSLRYGGTPRDRHCLQESRFALYKLQMDKKAADLPLDTPDVTALWQREMTARAAASKPVQIMQVQVVRQGQDKGIARVEVTGVGLRQ